MFIWICEKKYIYRNIFEMYIKHTIFLFGHSSKCRIGVNTIAYGSLLHYINVILLFFLLSKRMKIVCIQNEMDEKMIKIDFVYAPFLRKLQGISSCCLRHGVLPQAQRFCCVKRKFNLKKSYHIIVTEYCLVFG